MPPVGFCGAFRITSRVRSVEPLSSSAGSKLKPRSSRSGSGTGVAPAKRTADS